MRGKILLVTALDDTHRQLLLQSQGYAVVVVRHAEVLECLRRERYQLVLTTTDDGMQAVTDVCAKVREHFPDVKVAVVAQRSEYVPGQDCMDAVIRQQHSPAKFLSIINKLMEMAGGQSASIGK
ncbi:MAG: hypothetical protein ACXVZX_13725 [Terriglobales bacterium]